jgi:hypothetical protein
VRSRSSFPDARRSAVPSPTDIQDLLPFYESGRSEAGFDTGIERALERLLVSPQFLFRVEREPPGAAPGTAFKASDIELASRLSFFLWSSIPDDQLLKVAEQGRLSDPAVLDREVRRMLRDRRSRALVTNFAEQWLFVRDIEAKQPDGLLFPDFDETLRAAMRGDDPFPRRRLRNNRSVLDLLNANYTFMNERLAGTTASRVSAATSARDLPYRSARRLLGGQHPHADVMLRHP